MKNNERQFTEITLKQRKGMEDQGNPEWETPEERAESLKRWEKYVADAKADGTYGQEYEMKIEIEHDDSLDNHKGGEYTSTHSLFLFDTNKNDR